MSDEEAGPLGKPIRKEDWYFITETALVTCTVTVFPGEIVGISSEVYNQLERGIVEDSGDDAPDAVYLVHYDALVPLLIRNGFARL